MSSPLRCLYVVGAGGHAREVAAYVSDMALSGTAISLRGFFDDRLAPGMHGRLSVLGPLGGIVDVQTDAEPVVYLTALGDNITRRRVVERVEALSGGTLAAWKLVHPRAWLGEEIEIGEGTCVAPAAVLTCHVRLGRHCIVNVKASISHDCSVGDFANINPGATICGGVTIGDGAYIGAGATIKDKVSIGAWATIGAGAVVTRDIPPNVTAVGVPARVIRHHGSDNS